MTSFIYAIVIQPLQYLIEVIYVILYRFLGNVGLALVGLSVAVSTLVLPLYVRAEAIREEERNVQKKIKKWTDHIRNTFTGDERYMMQNAYYREQGYHPLHAFRGTLSLLLQVPFFLAAYQFLSHLELLQGISFGPIRDLGAEDALLCIAGRSINLLPILMTLINMVSSAIYTKGFSAGEKIQPYVLACLFLFFLYHSPSGLVLYWTANNLYSFIKNTVIGRRWIVNALRISAAAVLSLLFCFLLWQNGYVAEMISGRKYEDAFSCFLLLLLIAYPLWRHIAVSVCRRLWRTRQEDSGEKVTDGMILLEETGIVLLLGFYIPLTVISASPGDFVAVDRARSPLYILLMVFLVTAGIFLFWGTVISRMSDRKGKNRYGRFLFLLLIALCLDTFSYKPFTGRVSTFLKFEFVLKSTVATRAGNLVLLFLAGIAGAWIWRNRKGWVKNILLVFLLTVSLMSGRSLIRTVQALRVVPEQRKDDREHSIPLSTKGRNVVVIMLDRAIGAYVPFIFEEKPELFEKYSGFVFYPNTASFGLHTNYASPALFGGYEYTPAAMNRRSKEYLSDKHDEALQVMPLAFRQAGGRVTIGGLPYTHYNNVMDTGFLNHYDGIDVFDLNDRFARVYETDEYRQMRIRDFLFYSIFKASPVFLQDDIYDHGAYLAADWNPYMSERAFMQSYSALQGLSGLTEVVDTGENTLFLYDNEITHESVILSTPAYDLSDYDQSFRREMAAGNRVADGVEMNFEQENSIGFYHSNMAAFLLLGEWLDDLRRLGVYDNTRIILVADHGGESGQFKNMMFRGIDVEGANPLLMVKDFDSHEFRVDERFMTNADVPALAMDGIVVPFINPATGNEIKRVEEGKYADVIWADDWDVEDNNGTVFRPFDADWYHVEENIFLEQNWTATERE